MNSNSSSEMLSKHIICSETFEHVDRPVFLIAILTIRLKSIEKVMWGGTSDDDAAVVIRGNEDGSRRKVYKIIIDRDSYDIMLLESVSDEPTRTFKEIKRDSFLMGKLSDITTKCIYLLKQIQDIQILISDDEFKGQIRNWVHDTVIPYIK